MTTVARADLSANLSAEYLFTYEFALPASNPPVVIGEVNEGISFIVAPQGSTIAGPKINGVFSPEARDYVTIARNGVSTHEVRAVIVADDGALITFIYEGRGFFGENGYADFLEGRIPDSVKVYGAPHMQTSHPDYLWVNRLQCVNIGAVDVANEKFTCDVYALQQ